MATKVSCPSPAPWLYHQHPACHPLLGLHHQVRTAGGGADDSISDVIGGFNLKQILKEADEISRTRSLNESYVWELE